MNVGGALLLSFVSVLCVASISLSKQKQHGANKAHSCIPKIPLEYSKIYFALFSNGLF
jgi:hypothetical protein